MMRDPSIRSLMSPTALRDGPCRHRSGARARGDARQIVANFDLDMIGRNWKDTVVAIGKRHSDLGATLHRIAKEARILRLAYYLSQDAANAYQRPT